MFKKIWSEFETKLCPLYGTTSIVLLAMQFFGLDIADSMGGYEKTLLRSYIFLTIWYYTSYRILPKYIKNMRKNNKNFFTVQVIQIPVLWTLIDIVWRFVTNRNINFSTLARSYIFMVIMLVIIYTIWLLAEKAYYKRINKKLQEYKQQQCDDDKL